MPRRLHHCHLLEKLCFKNVSLGDRLLHAKGDPRQLVSGNLTLFHRPFSACFMLQINFASTSFKFRICKMCAHLIVFHILEVARASVLKQSVAWIIGFLINIWYFKRRKGAVLEKEIFFAQRR